MSTSVQIDTHYQDEKSLLEPTPGADAAAPAPISRRDGLRFQFKVLPNENQAEFDTLLAALTAEYQPLNFLDEMLVDDMARSEWISRRVQTVIDKLMAKGCEDPKILALWLRFYNTYRRGFHKNHAELLKLRAERRRDQIGFERQKLAAAAEARKLQVAETRIRVQNSQITAREIATKIKSAKLAQLTTPKTQPTLSTQVTQVVQVSTLQA